MVIVNDKKTEIKKNLDEFEKNFGNGQPVNFWIEGSGGEPRKVSKEEFANWIAEGKGEKNIKTPPKERIIYGASGDIDSITYFTEIKSKDEVIKESYCRLRSEEEKQQIRKRQEMNRKKREQELEESKRDLEQEIQNQEKSQTKTSPNPDKKDQTTQEKTNQQDFSQKSDNKESAEKKDKLAANQQSSLQDKDNNHQNIYYGVGVVSLVLLVISVAVVRVKKKR